MTAPRSGLLVCAKPPGPTSHTAVVRVRRALAAAKAGHAGTLDPFASGVLLVGLGRATRLLEYLVGHPKTYRARIRLGEQRDTLDRTGRITATAPVPALSQGEIERLLDRFRGTLIQVPPAYSAVKVGGQALYRRARRGERVEPPARTVEVRRLDLIAVDLPEIEVEVECSAGTYIRSLARDLGRAAGCGAVLWELERVRSGPFSLGDAVPLDEVEELGTAAWERVLPPERMVEGLPRVEIGPDEAARLAHGTAVEWAGPPREGPVAVFGPAGELTAVGRVEKQRLRPVKVFAA